MNRTQLVSQPVIITSNGPITYISSTLISSSFSTRAHFLTLHSPRGFDFVLILFHRTVGRLLFLFFFNISFLLFYFFLFSSTLSSPPLFSSLLSSSLPLLHSHTPSYLTKTPVLASSPSFTSSPHTLTAILIP